jgi:HPt (histidine-containing phosphotransfer) domain-containing protein
MPDILVIQPEPVTSTALSLSNGAELSSVTPKPVHFSAFSTLDQLPGFASNVSIQTTGEELGLLFKRQPELPGVILFDEGRFTGVISQAHYYKCISRAFGREVYYSRPSVIMLSELTVLPLVMSSECLIDSAVEQCLARPADFVYEPFLVHNEKSGQYRLCAFQMLLLASSQLATLRNQQMEQILNSVTDGLLVIDRNFRIGGEYSKVVGKLFERSDLRDVPLPEVLEPLIDSVTHEQLQDYLKILFDPKLIDRLIKSINPAKQISARFSSSDAPSENRIKHFTLNFERIRVQQEISQVLVRIEDITQRINLARELEQQEAAAEEKLHLVMQILQVEPDALDRFLARYDEALSALAKLWDLPEGGPLPLEKIHSIFRQVHTLKGEAALMRLSSYERALHQLEDQLEKIRSNPQVTTHYLVIIQPFYDTLKKLGEQIHEAIEQLKQFGNIAKSNGQAPAATSVAQSASLIGTLTRLVSDLNERLGKSAALHTTINETDFPEAYTDVLHEALMHLARNSMVHGIESTAERTALGKNPSGLIQLELKSHAQFYEIVFQDDGRGLDYDRIRQRASELGWNLTSEEELRNAIFEPGFSTAKNVTDLAGRGVGLDAIRNSLQAVGGRILPYSEQGAYCAFQILLPRTSTPPIT